MTYVNFAGSGVVFFVSVHVLVGAAAAGTASCEELISGEADVEGAVC